MATIHSSITSKNLVIKSISILHPSSSNYSINFGKLVIINQ